MESNNKLSQQECVWCGEGGDTCQCFDTLDGADALDALDTLIDGFTDPTDEEAPS